MTSRHPEVHALLVPLHEDVAALIGEHANELRPGLANRLAGLRHPSSGEQFMLFEFVRLRELMITAAIDLEEVIDQL